MEVGVKVYAENIFCHDIHHVASYYLIFIATDKEGIPIPVPEVIPTTKDQKRRYFEANIRREKRLLERVRKKAKMQGSGSN